MKKRPEVVIDNGGSWGMGFSFPAAERTSPTLIIHSPERYRKLSKTRRDEKYLGCITIPDNVRLTRDLEAVRFADVLVMVVPSHLYRAEWERVKRYVNPRTAILSLSKGLEEGTGCRMSQIITEDCPKLKNQVAVLSGPTFAKDVAKGEFTQVDLASANYKLAERLKGLFETTNFKINTTDDVPGVEAGGTIKTVLSMAEGMADGLNLSAVFRGALACWELDEMKQFVVALGGRSKTSNGASGLGDLRASSTPASRNWEEGCWVGKLGQEQGVPFVFSANKTVEGLHAAKVIPDVADKLGIQVPICSFVRDVFYNKLDPRQGFEDLKKAF